MIDWMALADDYEDMAKKYRAAGNEELARYWNSWARAAKNAARQTKQEQQHAKDIDRPEVRRVDAD